MDIEVTIEPAEIIESTVAPAPNIDVEVTAGRPGIPAGGDTNQVLKKNSPTSYDASWQDETGGGGVSAWGDLTGTLSDQEDLQAALDAKANSSDVTTALSGKASTSHTHSIANVTDLQTALDEKVESTTVAILWTGTQTAYDAIAVKDANTLYVITE
jgi:hypothetical protein